MNNDSPVRALIVVISTALVCSIMVTVAVVTLQPIQQAYQDLERNRYLVGISGLTDGVEELSDREVVSRFQALDARIVDLDRGDYDERYNPATFDTWQAAADAEFSIAIPAAADLAKLSRRSRLVTVYLVNENADLKRMLLPIYGEGMWSTVYGFIALEADLNTIADITFYKHGETAGIGDRILNPEWQASWRGRKLYDEAGILRFGVRGGTPGSTTLDAIHEIDALTGATVTVDAVANLVSYWFGPHGFAPFLESVRKEESR